MQIILPPHKKQSQIISKLTDELEDDIAEMEKMIAKNKFENGRSGFAVAHCQVSQNPHRVFVVREGMMPHTVIINPKIVTKLQPFTAKEICLSFPFRAEIKVKRFYEIVVEYQDRYLNKHQQGFQGKNAQIFQHEIQHFAGQTIYD